MKIEKYINGKNDYAFIFVKRCDFNINSIKEFINLFELNNIFCEITSIDTDSNINREINNYNINYVESYADKESKFVDLKLKIQKNVLYNILKDIYDSKPEILLLTNYHQDVSFKETLNNSEKLNSEKLIRKGLVDFIITIMFDENVASIGINTKKYEVSAIINELNKLIKK